MAADDKILVVVGVHEGKIVYFCYNTVIIHG